MGGGGFGVAGGTPAVALAQGPVPLFQRTDRIVGPVRGTVGRARWHALHYGARRPAEVGDYLREVYRLAPQVGIDPALVVAQSNLETDTWRTGYWADHLNPAGIGITHDGAASFTWANGVDAARGQIVHLYLYAVGKIPAGHPLHPYKPLDPRYDAAVSAGYAGIAETIDDLSRRWATDPDYGRKIAGRANDLFVRHRLLALTGTPNANDPALADDLDGGTAWRTIAPDPRSASLRVDLGGNEAIGTIRWLFKRRGGAGRLRIQVSGDGATWTTLAVVGDAPALVWQALPVAASGRYVRFHFGNPADAPSLGSLAEVQVWPPTSPAL